MSAPPTLSELASLWPMGVVLLIGIAAIIYSNGRDKRAWREWESRMRKRELNKRGVHRN